MPCLKGTVVALRDAAAALVKKFDQPPPTPEIHPKLVEEGPVDKVVLRSLLAPQSRNKSFGMVLNMAAENNIKFK
ncbi:hypothetical protein EYF80_037645 [Liparis tanakae]|uniref:Uncharacterized protein n=1 Tax=Liparis tanakae TaxID=230148 RepID=A0A4Z2GH07_9TELE|nr:hypothetical protein EYF80_037645 [Liparis tanakae]